MIGLPAVAGASGSSCVADPAIAKHVIMEKHMIDGRMVSKLLLFTNPKLIRRC